VAEEKLDLFELAADGVTYDDAVSVFLDTTALDGPDVHHSTR
jgi:hypothetical protein